MSRKLALVIGNTEYTDPGLRELSAPGKDAQEFARVLRDAALCAFDEVRIVVNEPSSTAIEAIDEFFDGKKPDDLLVLYFSGHGVRDELGSLYLAFKNTIRTRLRATAIKSDYIRESMDQSRSKRQVIVLDCCNSGAFPQGTKAEIGGPMGLTSAFQGYGRFVLMASDSTQFAWEGDRVIGETNNSLFTHFLVKGLEGEADSDGDGKITVEELYDYAFDAISKVTTKQTPTKAASKVEGDIVLRQITRLEDIKPMALPGDLLEELDDTRPYVRAAVVEKLEKILRGKNLAMARSAVPALEKIVADGNTTRTVAEVAQQALDSYRKGEFQAAEAAAAVAGAPPPSVIEPPLAVPTAPEPKVLIIAKPDAKASSPAERPLNRMQPRFWAAGIAGLVVISAVVLWLSGALSHGATPAPTDVPAAHTSTPPAADTATAAGISASPSAAAAAPADSASATSTVPAASEPKIGSPEESLAIWNDNNSSIVDKALAQNAKLDDSQPGTFTYPVSVSRSDRVRWEWFWCANSQSILEDNLSNINVKFELDGQDVTPLLQHTDFQYSGASCRDFFVAVSEWPAGTFHLTNTAALVHTVNDGSSDYTAGNYVYNYEVTAK